MNIWRDNYYMESDYDSKMKLSIIFSFAYNNVQISIPGDVQDPKPR